jgi:hypothetical protein
MGEIHLWQWRYTDDFGKRRVRPSKLSFEDAKRWPDAERVDGSLDIRTRIRQTSNWLRSLPLSESTAALSRPGSCSDTDSSKA